MVTKLLRCLALSTFALVNIAAAPKTRVNSGSWFVTITPILPQSVDTSDEVGRFVNLADGSLNRLLLDFGAKPTIRQSCETQRSVIKRGTFKLILNCDGATHQEAIVEGRFLPDLVEATMKTTIWSRRGERRQLTYRFVACFDRAAQTETELTNRITPICDFA